MQIVLMFLVHHKCIKDKLTRFLTQKHFHFFHVCGAARAFFLFQVVFQSSTLGVLLADPTQLKVKVKFEGNAAGEPEVSQQFVSFVIFIVTHLFINIFTADPQR